MSVPVCVCVCKMKENNRCGEVISLRSKTTHTGEPQTPAMLIQYVIQGEAVALHPYSQTGTLGVDPCR